MRTLLLLRHAKSSHADEGVADHDRPLTRRGRRDAQRLGRLLDELDLMPQVIIASTAQRTLETAELLVEASGTATRIDPDERLYLASSGAILRILQQAPIQARCLMAVGHNPGLEELLTGLTGRAEQMRTATLAQIEFPIDSWTDVKDGTRGRLKQMWRARDLDDS
ncbi:MAG: histidine phosphatase family protein [Phycisphaerales bacterium]|nr:histidine phosphatase family protein [Phycisphaerales bacterium]